MAGFLLAERLEQHVLPARPVNTGSVLY